MKSQVYSVLSGETIEIHFPSTLIPPSVKHPLRKHSAVTVKNSLTGKIMCGQIVSHLPLSDWAVANGFTIISTGRTYSASTGEVTRLF
jgi:hypothetical protein